MKKITYLIIFVVLLMYINACAGYKPIFSSSNIQFEIADYTIEGDKKLGKQIYSKLYNLTKSNKKNTETKNIYIKIKVTKEKIAKAKDIAGKILEYKINLDTNIIVKNYLTGDELLNQDFNYFLSYKVQDQYSETMKLENQSIKNLINKTSQDLLIRLIENI